MSECNDLVVLKICPKCKRRKAVNLSESDFQSLKKYYNGEGLIQDMIPDVPAPKRELLRGGMCGECWRKIFGSAPGEDADSEHIL